MRLEHFIVARASAIDKDRNTISVFDILEDITLGNVAGTVPIPVEMIIVFRREKGETGPVKHEVSLRSGPESTEKRFLVSFAEHHTRYRVRTSFPLFVCEGENTIDLVDTETDLVYGQFVFNVHYATESG